MNQTITISIEHIGDIVWQNQHSLLEALEDAGVDIDYSCRAGACSACKLTLLSGKIHWRNQPIASIHGNEVLACSVVPLTDIKIALLG
jgi:ferredoxin